MFKFIYAVAGPFFRLLYRIKVTGKENIPESPVVVCANHTALWDPIFLCLAFGIKQKWAFMAKMELFKIPVLSWILKKVDAIPVNRGSTDISTLRTAISSLTSGRSLMIFPEGTRTDGETDASAAKTGAAMIACRAKVDMLPVFVSTKKHIFGKVNVIIGKPIKAEAEGSGNAKYKALVENVFGEILRLGGEE